MPVTNKISITVERASNGYTIRVSEQGRDEKYVADSDADLPVVCENILTEWANRPNTLVVAG